MLTQSSGHFILCNIDSLQGTIPPNHEASPSQDTLKKPVPPKEHSPDAKGPLHTIKWGDIWLCPRAITGTLHSTKGARPMVAGVIIECPKHATRAKKTECRPILETWSGQRVTVHGDLSVYRCGPMEQCLMGGVIPYLLNITRIEKADQSTPNTKLQPSTP